MKQWQSYHERVGEIPNPIVVSVLKEYVHTREGALDLGAGNLRDSKFLIKQGFKRVVAVDFSQESYAFLTEGIELEICPIQIYEPEANTFDFAVSCNTLFFLTFRSVTEVFRNVFEGLRSGGVFACNVLGSEDDWGVCGGGPSVSSFTEETLRSLCKDFKILDIGESRNHAHVNTPEGLANKFWHQWSIVVQKP